MNSGNNYLRLQEVKEYIGNLLSALVAPPEKRSSVLDRFTDISEDANIVKFLSSKECNVLQLAVNSPSSGEVYAINTNLGYKDVGAEYVVLLEKKSQVDTHT